MAIHIEITVGNCEKYLVVYAENAQAVIFDMCCVNKYAQFKLLYGETT